MVMFTMYFDDATMQDWGSEAIHTQERVAELMKLLGSHWAGAESQVCKQEGDFLGLMHTKCQVQERE